MLWCIPLSLTCLRGGTEVNMDSSAGMTCVRRWAGRQGGRTAGHTRWRSCSCAIHRGEELRGGSVSRWPVFPVTHACQRPHHGLVLRAGGQQPRAAVEAGDNLAVGEGGAMGGWMVHHRQ